MIFASSPLNLTWAEGLDGDLDSLTLLIHLCIFSESAFKLTDFVLLTAFFCVPIQGDCLIVYTFLVPVILITNLELSF